jgi:molybdopterin molybdotransferase
MLEVAAALEIVLQHARPLTPEPFPLDSQSLGQVLAAPIQSDIDSPPYTKALMDGYAVRANECTTPNTVLTVIEEIAAGQMPTKKVEAGQASRIMTGAPLPDGADAVVPHEKTTLAGTQVTLQTAPRVGEHILERGREMQRGETVLTPGTILRAQEYGLLATVGHTSVSAYPLPKVGVISTGDEIVEPDQRPGPGQIRNSNGPMLLAAAVFAGGLAQYFGRASDTRAELTALVREAFDEADIVILSGGVSAGKFDFVPEVLAELGVTTHFHKILMKPGKPLLFGTNQEKLVFGLPGNPVSSFVCFHLFIRPAIRKLRGETDWGPTFVPMPLACDFTTDNNRPTYGPAKLELTEQGISIRPLAWFGSADLRGLCGCDALVSVPAGRVSYQAGQTIPALLLNLA